MWFSGDWVHLVLGDLGIDRDPDQEKTMSHRLVLVIAVAALALTSFTPAASAGVPLQRQSLNSGGAVHRPVSSTVAVHPLNTLYETNGDYVHITAGDASGHGWWEKVSGTASTAKVTIWLEENLGGTWYVEASGTYTGGPGPGSGRWANARYACIPTTGTYQWRSRIDVDIIGEQDAPDQAITKTQALHCL
jgi:hypothetical protein